MNTRLSLLRLLNGIGRPSFENYEYDMINRCIHNNWKSHFNLNVDQCTNLLRNGIILDNDINNAINKLCVNIINNICDAVIISLSYCFDDDYKLYRFSEALNIKIRNVLTENINIFIETLKSLVSKNYGLFFEPLMLRDEILSQNFMALIAHDFYTITKDLSFIDKDTKENEHIVELRRNAIEELEKEYDKKFDQNELYYFIKMDINDLLEKQIF